MKKLMVACLLFLVLLSGVKHSKFSLLDYFSGEYSVYTKETVQGSTDLGFCHVSNETNNGNDVIGESVRVKNFEPISALETLNAELIKTEVLDTGTVVMYAFTDLIDENVELDGKSVNLQLAVYDDYCIIGWPLILGSF